MFIIANVPRKNESNNEPITLSSDYLLASRLFVWVGSISYALYLWHWPLWVFVTYYIECDNVWYKFALIETTFVIAYLSTKYIENIFRDKNKTSKMVVWSSFLVTWVVLLSASIVIGYYGIGGIKINETTPTLTTNMGTSIEHVDVNNKITSTNPTTTTVNKPKTQTQLNLTAETYENTIAKVSSNTTSPPPPPTTTTTTATTKPKQLSQVTTTNLSTPPPIFVNNYISVKSFENVSQSLPWQNSFYYYPHKKIHNNTSICVSVWGSSHTAMLGDVFDRLGLERNISISYFCQNGKEGNVHNPLKPEDIKRLEELKQQNPKALFVSDFWTYWEENTQERTKFVFETFRQYLPNTTKIVFYGDVPQFPIPKSRPLLQEIEQYRIKKGSYDFLSQSREVRKEERLRIEKDIGETIEKYFKNDNIFFYPNVADMFTDPETGFVQFLGSENGGKALYKDNHHLNRDGSKRLEKYILEHVFKDLKC
eukprot:Pgem_evm1s17894